MSAVKPKTLVRRRTTGSDRSLNKYSMKPESFVIKLRAGYPEKCNAVSVEIFNNCLAEG